MKNVMGVIYTGEKDELLRELAISRAIAALPIAGRYRIIDFIISSMVNSNMNNVGVIMQKNYHSLMDHLGSGKEYDLHGKNDGLFILPPFLTRDNIGVYHGLLDALRSNMSYLRRSKQEYIVVCNSHLIFNDKLNSFFKNHLQQNADISILYSKDHSLQRNESGAYLKINEVGEVEQLEYEPTNPSYENTSMEIYLMKTEFLIELVNNATSHGFHNFVTDVIQKMVLDKKCKVVGYEYTKKAYLVDSITAYFDANMQLLNAENRKELFWGESTVYTKVRDELPARYCANSKVINSLVADGAQVMGEVENSVVFRGVRIDEGAKIKNCVIMQDAHVEKGVTLENCILDKQTVIKAYGRLIGPKSYPIVIAKRMIV
ncbi:MAG: glucose-1-phosphate adenylyltransferase subunit GlgD [Eubacteriales bacterium]|nr:glucose-1-phosphate adenylyltransferase subunit GlgD [Eubacteriales bacterium]